MDLRTLHSFFKDYLFFENQDGGVGRHTAPPRTTRTDENRMARKSDTKEIKNKQTSRPVGGAERGTRAERTGLAVADRDWWSVGQAGQVVQPLADPAAPHLRTDKPRWPDSRVAGSEADCITQGQGWG